MKDVDSWIVLQDASWNIQRKHHNQFTASAATELICSWYIAHGYGEDEERKLSDKKNCYFKSKNNEEK